MPQQVFVRQAQLVKVVWGLGPGYDADMAAIPLVGWPQGLPTGHAYELAPLGWTVLILLVIWTAGVRIPPWAVPVAAASSLLWSAAVHQLGLWTPPVGPMLAIAAAAAFLIRVAPRIT